MKELKDNGIEVVPMKDFLAWRRGEKSIPPKSAVITIDDGYVSGYAVAWPILKEFGYPFTMFIYTNYVGVGGKSITWAQLEQMRDAGVDIESHTVSHHDLRHAPKGQDYTAWLHNEIYGSKDILEQKLGIKIVAFAFPYGTHNEVVRKMAMEAGYQALFTVYGQHMGIDAAADQLGRYAIESMHPDVFKMAVNFGNNDGVGPGVEAAQLASAAMVTQPMNEEKIPNTRPVIKANLASMGEVEPSSVEMRVSGFGPGAGKIRSANEIGFLRVYPEPGSENIHRHSLGEGEGTEKWRPAGISRWILQRRRPVSRLPLKGHNRVFTAFRQTPGHLQGSPRSWDHLGDKHQ